jgi:4-hydroxy-2-oxoheptanedioate aldolase
MTRAAEFGANVTEYLSTASDLLLTVVQVETAGTVEAAADIAAVDGVDVLFVGPFDLSLSMGIPQQFENPDFHNALKRVAQAARDKGKAAGILLSNPDHLERTIDWGFTFVGLGSDSAVLAKGSRALAAAFEPYR